LFETNTIVHLIYSNIAWPGVKTGRSLSGAKIQSKLSPRHKLGH